MSLYGTMNTSISGMNAQTNKLGSVGENIANSDTNGYKRANVKFSTFLLPSSPTTYTSGGVVSQTTYEISVQGNLKPTSSPTDIGIKGRGFFVVQDQAGANFLTRAGSFTIDDGGNLVNTAGFTLMGSPFVPGSSSNQVNGLSGLEKVQVAASIPVASATHNIKLGANLDARKGVTAAANLPSANAANAHHDFKTSVTTYDPIGREVIYDVYYTKKSEAVAATAAAPAVDAQWDVAVYRKDEANAVSGGFPYSNGGAAGATSIATNTMTLTFDAFGNLSSPVKSLNIVDNKSIPAQSIKIDFSSMVQKATDYSAISQSVDGQKATKLASMRISTDGMMYAVYGDNTTVPIYRIPLADVPSPDNLESMAGNVYRSTAESGVVFTGFPTEGSFGQTISGTLEASNVDLASELTDMIQAQRIYTANSKVFQTSSELLDVLVNLKR